MQEKMTSLLSSLCACSRCFQLTLVFPLWIFFLARLDSVSTVNSTEEVSALINFSNANSFDSDYGAYWNSWEQTDATPCAWFGVTCGANSTVEQLDFSGWGLNIQTVEALYNLTDLRSLDLSFNVIDPSNIYTFEELCNLTLLTQLDLSSGLIIKPPLISGCRNLRFLALENNQIGTLPTGLSDLVNLQFLSLANNSLTGPFPTEQLGNLSSLVILDLSSNSFTGHIPSLLNLTGLFQLILDNNQFTGFDEAWAIGAEYLFHLSISSNRLEGPIPSTVANFSNLSFLDMSRNNLSGGIPHGFSQLLNFSYSTLDLSQNQLTGNIPTDMLVQTNPNVSFAALNLSWNLLTGNIPLDGSNIISFLLIDLSYNNLSGSHSLNALNHQTTNMSQLRLNNNQLSGDLLDMILFSGPYALAAIELRLENNLFTGDLSRISTLVNSSFVPIWQIVDVSNNNLQWSTSEGIPDPIAATLQVLTSARTKLQQFQVGGNNFSGTPLPTTCIVYDSNYSVLQILDLSNSHLQGEILSVAFNHTCLPQIQLLNLSNNHATGPLSESVIGNQQNFIIDVSNNLLSGPLPAILQSSDLYNPKYFQGNGLCGEPLPPCGRGTVIQWWVLVIIIGASVIIVTATCLVASWRLKVYHKQHQQDADLIRTLLERDSASLMSLRTLRKATGNFADSAQIGEGGFGTVYLGRLTDGTTVAIKRSKREGSEKDKDQFLNEVRILSQVNHRNLVKLMGCCMENKIALLVYEFISNGTLQEHLQGKIGPVRLSWKQRLHIAVQTSDALNYLHSMASFPIYHRDVKSANILLDENFNAKVSDFGISKLAPLKATHVSTAAIQGTIGYIDPEYYTSCQLTDKSDVYSFGVVLLELISGKAAVDFRRGGEETGLVNFARPYIERGDLEGFADPALGETYSSNGSKSILSLGKIAMKCVDIRSKARPRMQEVLKELQNVLADVNSTSKQLESNAIGEDSNEDLESGERSLVFDSSFTLFDSSFTDSSSFVMRSDHGRLGIQMSEVFGPRS